MASIVETQIAANQSTVKTRKVLDERLPTLRDQFAMAALTGYCLRPYDAATEGGTGGLFMARARLAYEHADAMLLARNQTEENKGG